MPIPSYGAVRAIPLLSLSGASSVAIKPNSGAGVPPEKQAAILQTMSASFASLPAASKDALSGYWHEWAHVDSQFVTAAVAVDTSELTAEQRLYLPLLDEMAFKLPCTCDDGTVLSKDALVTGLQADTVRFSCGPGGIRAGSSQLFTFWVQVELDKGAGLGLALKWLRRVLYQTSYSAELIGIAVQRLLSQVPAAVRSGQNIANALIGGLTFDPNAANDLAYHAIKQQPFLTKLQAQLATPAGAAAAVATLSQLRAALLVPSRVNLFVAADLTALASPYPTLAAAILPPSPAPPLAAGVGPVGPFSAVSESLIKLNQEGRATLCSLSAIETHFVYARAPGLGVYSADHAALLVAIEYLTALEGDFWVKLRGAGLTYSYRISASTDTQTITFALIKCTDLLGAYSAAKAIIVDYASGTTSISPIELEGSKSTVAYSIIQGASTRLSAAAAAWEAGYEAKGVDYGKWLLAQVDAVTAVDALHALKKYIVPLFDPSANLAATCPPNKLDDDLAGLSEVLGTHITVLKEEDLYGAFDRTAKAAGPPAKAPRPMGKGGGAFSFAKQFKCECPKCEVPPEPVL